MKVILQEYVHNSCHIKINDECCKDVTDEQVSQAAKKIGRIYRESEIKKIQRGKEE